MCRLEIPILENVIQDIQPGIPNECCNSDGLKTPDFNKCNFNIEYGRPPELPSSPLVIPWTSDVFPNLKKSETSISRLNLFEDLSENNMDMDYSRQNSFEDSIALLGLPNSSRRTSYEEIMALWDQNQKMNTNDISAEQNIFQNQQEILLEDNQRREIAEEQRRPSWTSAITSTRKVPACVCLGEKQKSKSVASTSRDETFNSLPQLDKEEASSWWNVFHQNLDTVEESVSWNDAPITEEVEVKEHDIFCANSNSSKQPYEFLDAELSSLLNETKYLEEKAMLPLVETAEYFGDEPSSEEATVITFLENTKSAATDENDLFERPARKRSRLSISNSEQFGTLHEKYLSKNSMQNPGEILINSEPIFNYEQDKYNTSNPMKSEVENMDLINLLSDKEFHLIDQKELAPEYAASSFSADLDSETSSQDKSSIESNSVVDDLLKNSAEIIKKRETAECSFNNLSIEERLRMQREKNKEASRKLRLKKKMMNISLQNELGDLEERNEKLKREVRDLEEVVSQYRKIMFQVLLKH